MKPGKHQRRKKEAEIGVSFTAFLLTYNRNKPVSFLLFCQLHVNLNPDFMVFNYL